MNTKYVLCEFMSARRHPHELGIRVEGVGKERTVGEICKIKNTEGLCELFGVGGERNAGEDMGGLEKMYSDGYFEEGKGGGKRTAEGKGGGGDEGGEGMGGKRVKCG